MSVPVDREGVTWSWSQHLRDGGTTPWRDWVAAGHPDHPGRPFPSRPPGWTPPGAAQLELVRRLAAADRLHGPAFTRLADLVLTRSGPGRGLAHQPLAWPGDAAAPADPGRRFGAPAVDPADVPLEELVRLAVGTLTELLLRVPPPAEPRPPRRRLLTRTPSLRLAGAPVTTSAVRRELGRSGLVEGGRRPRVVLLAEPLDVALAQVWSARVQRGAPVRWRGFLSRWSGSPHLPPAADLPALARLWAERVGPAGVHVVVAPTAAAAARTAAGVLDTRLRPRAGDAAARTRDLSPAAVDVVRRVNGVLTVRLEPARRAAVTRQLVATLDVAGPADAGLTVPDQHAGWVRDRAARLADDLAAGGYPVHGRLADLAPVLTGLPTRPPQDGVLTAAQAACLDLASRDHDRQAETR